MATTMQKIKDIEAEMVMHSVLIPENSSDNICVGSKWVLSLFTLLILTYSNDR